MMYVKKILIILAIPYVLWHLYGDFLEYKNIYTYEEVKELERFGKKLIDNSYTGRRCYGLVTDKSLGHKDCIKNLKIKDISLSWDTFSLLSR